MALSHPKGDLKLTLTPPEVRYFDIIELQALAHFFISSNSLGQKVKMLFVRYL